MSARQVAMDALTQLGARPYTFADGTQGWTLDKRQERNDIKDRRSGHGYLVTKRQRRSAGPRPGR